MRPEVLGLVTLGSLPLEGEERPLDEMTALLKEFEEPLSALLPPATDEEAMALLGCFNPVAEDSCFGLAWAIVHFIETAPNWPGDPATTAIGQAFEAHLQKSDEPWMQVLWQRILSWRQNHEGSS